MSTLKQLVDETTNIKNELVECHTNLKDSLMDKGVEVNSDDKLRDLVNKTNLINGSKYKLNVKVSVQEEEPQSPNFGDIWIPLSEGDYNLNFSPNTIENPMEKDLHIRVSNMYVDFKLDESIKDFMQGLRSNFNINLITNSFENNPSNSMIPLLVNGVSQIFARIGVSKLWNDEENKWDRVYGKYWDGTNWIGFTSDEVVFYVIDNGTLKAIMLDTNETIWTYGGISKVYEPSIVIGQNHICVLNAPSTYSDNISMYIFDFNGKLISSSTHETRLSNWYGSNPVYCKDGSFIRYYNTNNNFSFLKYSELTGERLVTKNVKGYIYSNFTSELSIIDDLLVIYDSKSGNHANYIYAMNVNLQEDIFTVCNDYNFSNVLVLKDKTLCLLYYSKSILALRKIKIDAITQSYDYEDVSINITMPNSTSFICANSINPSTLEDIFMIIDKTNKIVYIIDCNGNIFNTKSISTSYFNSVLGYEGGNFIILRGSSSSLNSNYMHKYSFAKNEFSSNSSSAWKFYNNPATSSGVIGTFDENYGL